MERARKVIRCISPIDQSVFAERPAITSDEVRKLVDQAWEAHTSWAARPLSDRVDLVRAGVARLGEKNHEIVPELAKMMGRPVRYGGEFDGVDERASYMAEIAEKALEPIVIENNSKFERRIERVPHGLVFVIAPWNYPYLTAINTVAPALIAGNSVILKHASQTLMAGERLVEAFTGAGIPEHVFSNVFMNHEMTENLISSGCFGYVNFTGSIVGGQQIERAAAGAITPLGLELGGKDPGYVMEDADLDAAVETLIDAAMYNSGQCCCGIERIYVVEKLYDDFLDKAVGIVNDYKLGNPLDEETTLGPMANLRFAKLVREQTQEAVAAGATPLVSPKQFPSDDGGTYLMPQILTGVNHDMRIMYEESFGPVVGIMKVRDDGEAIELMNDSEIGLTASLWTNDPERASSIGHELDTGTVFMNRADYLDPALCWSGCRVSGKGGSLSVIGYHNLTKTKSYHLKKL